MPDLVTKPPPGTVPIMVGKELRYIPRDRAPDAAQIPGIRPASEDDISTAVRHAEEDTPLGKAGEYSYSVAKGITQGFLPKMLIEGAGLFGGQNTKDVMRQAVGTAEEEIHHPIIEAAASALPMMVAPELRGLSALGGESALGRAAMAAGKEAVWGSLPAAGHVVSEASIQNKDLAVQQLLSEMGMGAALASGSSLALHGAGRLFSREGAGLATVAAQKAEKSIAERLGAEGLEGAAQKPGTFAKLSAAASGRDAEAIQEFTGLNAQSSRARKILYEDAPKIHNDAVRNVTKATNELEDAMRPLKAQHAGEEKLEHIREHITTGNEHETIPLAKSQIQRVIDGADGLLNNPEGKYAPEYIESISKQAYKSQSVIEAAEKAGAKDLNAIAYQELDKLKRASQGVTKHFEKAIRNIDDPWKSKLAAHTYDWFKGEAEGLRTGLEAELLWGQAAKNQQAINSAFTENITAAERFNPAFTTKVGRSELDPYKAKWGADPEKVDRFIKGITDPKKDLLHQAAGSYVDSSERLAEAIGNSYNLTPAQAAQVDRAKAAVASFKGAIADASEASSIVNRGSRMAEAGEPGAAGAAAAFLMTGHPLGAAASMAYKALSNPDKTARVIYAIEKMMSSSESRVGQAVGSFLRGGAKAAGKAAGAEIKQSKDQLIAQAKDIIGISGNPDAMQERIERTIGNLGPHAPSLTAAMAAKMASNYAYLATKVPMTQINPSITPQFDKARYSDAELKKFAKTLDGVLRPMSLVDDMKHGKLSREKVEAVKATSPDLYKQIQDKILDEAALLQKKLPYDKQLQVSILFEAPVTPTMTPDFLASMQSTMAPPAPEPKAPATQGGSRRPFKGDPEVYNTATEDIAAGRD